MYYIIYCGILDQLTRIRDELLIAKEQDYLKERKKIIEDVINNLNKSIFDLVCAIELQKEGTAIENEA